VGKRSRKRSRIAETEYQSLKATAPPGPHPPPIIHPPGLLRDAAPSCEAASDDDREWFAGHPTESLRLRPYIPGELPDSWEEYGVTFFWGGHPRNYTLVIQIRPGFRTRYGRWLLPEIVPHVSFIRAQSGEIMAVADDEGLRLMAEHARICPLCRDREWWKPTTAAERKKAERPVDYLGSA